MSLAAPPPPALSAVNDASNPPLPPLSSPAPETPPAFALAVAPTFSCSCSPAPTAMVAVVAAPNPPVPPLPVPPAPAKPAAPDAPQTSNVTLVTPDAKPHVVCGDV